MNDIPRAAQDETDAELGERAAKINEQLGALEIQVNLWDHPEQSRFQAIVAELRDDNVALVAAGKRVGTSAGEELRAMAGRTHDSLDRFEGEVRAAWADFDAENAEDRASYRTATQRELEAWHGLLDRMRLQAQLGEMEARDAVAEMEKAFETARPELERAKEAAEDALDALKAKVREAIAHLRQAARDASQKMA